MATISELAEAVDVGLTVLTHRLFTLLALVMAFGLFCWAMYLSMWIQLWIAGTFGILIFLPVLFFESKKTEARHEES